ncbi:hypothetical protein JCM9140_2568 [Halalkalibacter wakoensis JCM 9140]|uniref:Regulator of polyketide synthase expression n=1 Tax=Halalkalibacter wakoensis JCM 9140 TaxID=1236970 RepID=W4Q3H6_9BACI|nr:helix-turn-helix domain-containing protein [Halalkalibacter wakoensis]GAE26495.1 hypothetical protein JCM9140_2568 [Halalkalibacter wakoensis JCM 9140]
MLGYIWVLEGGCTLNEQDLTDLKLIASKAKNQLLQLNLQKKKNEKNHQELLWQIITGDIESHETIANHLSNIGLHENKPLGMILFTFDSMNQELYKKKVYTAKTIQKVNILIETLDENQLIFLISPTSRKNERKDAIDFIHTFKIQVKDRFGITGLESGCGYMYEDYNCMKRSYDEAAKVIAFKKAFPEELANVTFYHELGVFRYIDLLKKTKELQQQSVNPAIQMLQHYDLENRTNLLETLEVILTKDGNMNEAAKALHCHVNTLTYRLKRIQEITSIQLKDPVQKLGLYLDLKRQ